MKTETYGSWLSRMESIRSSWLADSISNWGPFPLPSSFPLLRVSSSGKMDKGLLWALNPFFSLPYNKPGYCETHYRSKVTDWEKVLCVLA